MTERYSVLASESSPHGEMPACCGRIPIYTRERLQIKERALDRFCAHALADFEEAIQKEGCSNHERYLCLYKLVDNADERLSILFDQHSRSKAPLQLKLIRREGLVEDREMEGISDELLKSTEPR